MGMNMISNRYVLRCETDDLIVFDDGFILLDSLCREFVADWDGADGCGACAGEFRNDSCLLYTSPSPRDS